MSDLFRDSIARRIDKERLRQEEIANRRRLVSDQMVSAAATAAAWVPPPTPPLEARDTTKEIYEKIIDSLMVEKARMAVQCKEMADECLRLQERLVDFMRREREAREAQSEKDAQHEEIESARLALAAEQIAAQRDREERERLAEIEALRARALAAEAEARERDASSDSASSVETASIVAVLNADLDTTISLRGSKKKVVAPPNTQPGYLRPTRTSASRASTLRGAASQRRDSSAQ